MVWEWDLHLSLPSASHCIPQQLLSGSIQPHAQPMPHPHRTPTWHTPGAARGPSCPWCEAGSHQGLVPVSWVGSLDRIMEPWNGLHRRDLKHHLVSIPFPLLSRVVSSSVQPDPGQFQDWIFRVVPGHLVLGCLSRQEEHCQLCRGCLGTGGGSGSLSLPDPIVCWV